MKARMESLDMLANNMANSGTAGFKADREFSGLFESQLPVNERHWTDFGQGVLLPTSNPLQLGLDGAGFFALNSPTGVIYTRNGDFRINGSNQLATAEGHTLRNVRDNGQPIAVDPLRPIAIDRAGIVSQDGLEVGQIEISGVRNAPDVLSKLGTSYFALLDAGAVAPTQEAIVRQGVLEQSNAPVADAAVRLVSVMRQFEMLQRAMQVGAQMNEKAISQVAQVR